ncbi:MAG: DNA methyltransferase, partial [Shewanella sp.]
NEVGHNHEAKLEVRTFNKDDVFDTPKPERLISNVLHLASNVDDLVLDSFLGSGTTAAVAHKMGRRYIGIEMGEHAKTHCIPRLQKVIEGEQGGISQSVEWQGGGGFGFYTLHPEPVFQANGQIRPDIKFEPLAAYIWHMETGVGSSQTMDSPLLGVHNGIAYYLLYNGILGDRRPQGGNVLTRPILAWLQAEYPHDGPKVIYGESIRIGEERLAQANVTFKQIPYDVVLR